MLLEHFGYTVLPTTSVEDAETTAQARCPDMLLMDNTHPGIDFEQVAKQVKKVCPAVIAVVLSPYYYGARNGAGGAIDRFVAKDEGPDVLISQIEQLFGERAGGNGATSRPM
jgi:CheY-like chemotaxis protein